MLGSENQVEEALQMTEVPNNDSCSSRKSLLSSLISSLLKDIPEAEKKEMLQAVLKGDGEHRETIEMVEH